MCLSAEDIRNALLARQTEEKERIPRDKHSFHGRDYREPQHALAVSQSIKQRGASVVDSMCEGE